MAEQGVRLAHVVVRDQLAVCQFFARKAEFEKETSEQRKGTEGRSKGAGHRKSVHDDLSYDEFFDDAADLFDIDDNDKTISNLNETRDSSGNYQTEQAYHNELEGPLSITQRSSKFLQKVYVELLRVIRPLEKEGSYPRPAR